MMNAISDPLGAARLEDPFTASMRGVREALSLGEEAATRLERYSRQLAVLPATLARELVTQVLKRQTG